MKNMATMVGIVIVMLTTGLQADPMISFSGLPAIYTAGGDFSFEVHLSDAQNLSAYDIELVLTHPTGTAGTDYFFLSAATPASNYILNPDPGNFVHGINPPGQFDHLTLSDFMNAGTSSSISGTVAVVTVRTGAALVGSLSISIDSSTLALIDDNLNDIPGFANTASNLPTAQVSDIPEPQTLFTLATLMLLTVHRRSLLRPRSA